MDYNLTTLPNEVVEVLALQCVGYCGSKQYDKALETIRKYPEYFPWEHKYWSIPEEVRNKYWKSYNKRQEKKNKEWKLKHNPEGKGIYELIRDNSKPVELTYESLSKTISDLFYQREEQRQRELKELAIEKRRWNKYFKKYNLEYSETRRFI